jgi:hypothetical protein
MAVSAPAAVLPCKEQWWGWLPHSQLEFGLAGAIELNVDHAQHLQHVW